MDIYEGLKVPQLKPFKPDTWLKRHRLCQQVRDTFCCGDMICDECLFNFDDKETEVIFERWEKEQAA